MLGGIIALLIALFLLRVLAGAVGIFFRLVIIAVPLMFLFVVASALLKIAVVIGACLIGTWLFTQNN